jgi:Phage portal protein, SPP1 Gp6-like
LKVWKSGKVWRLNLFLPHKVEKYTASRNSDSSSGIPKFASFKLNETMENPFGFVPVFHFSLDADIGEFGQSEIDNLIPLNDALNKQVLDMLVASEFCAYPQRWAVGLETDNFPKDAKGNPISPFKLGVDGVWSVDSPDTKFGQFATANLDQYIHVQESLRAEIARVASIPLHYLMLQSATMASGRALQTAERRFLAKMLGIQISFGAKWAELMTFALKISKQSVNTRLFTQWADISSVSEMERLQTLQLKKSLGVPTSQLLIESGYGSADAAKLLLESIREKSQIKQIENQISLPQIPIPIDENVLANGQNQIG